MIRIWHDDAMRWLPLWLTITMLNTSALLGTVFWRRATSVRDLQLPLAWLLIILWLAVAFYILFGHLRTRCQRLEMTLPIPSQTLWRRHLAAVFVAGATVLAGSLGVLVLHATLISRIDRQEVLEIPYSSLIGPLLAGLLLAAAVVNSVEPGLQKLRGRATYWVLVLSSLVGIPLLLVWLVERPLVSVGICLTLTIAVARRAQRSLPAAFRLVPRTAASASTSRRVTASTDRTVGRWQVYRTLFHILHNVPPWKQFTPWMAYSFGALIAFVLAGGLERWISVPEVRLTYLPFGSYMLFAGIGLLTYNLFRLDSLPASRRTILAMLTLPGLAFFAAGYGMGWWARTTAPNASPLVDFKVQRARVELDLLADSEAKPRQLRNMVWVEVDPSFMGITLTGEPPTLTTSWGESHVAWSEKLFKNSSALLYSPYNTADETSADFEALMLSRAIKDVYGQTISPQELRERYFVVENNRVVALKSDLLKVDRDLRVVRPRQGIPLREDYPELEAPPKGPETAIYLLLVLVPWLLLTGVFLGSLRASRSNRFIRGVYWAGLAIPMLGLLSQVFLTIFGIFSPEAGRGFLEILIRSLGTTPISWLLTWVVLVLAVLLCFWLALRQFERAEIPAVPINCSLIDFARDD